MDGAACLQSTQQGGVKQMKRMLGLGRIRLLMHETGMMPV